MRKKRRSFDFMSNRRIFWLISVSFITVGIIANILLDTEIGMRFTGGAVLRYSFSDREELSGSDLPKNISSASDISASDVLSMTDIEITPNYSKTINAQEAADLIYEALGVRVTVAVNEKIGDENGNKSLVVTFLGGDTLGHNADAVIRAALRKGYPNVSLILDESNSYSAMVGRDFFYKCLVAVFLAVVFTTVFLAIRFHSSCGFSVGICGIIAVLHDVAIVYFAFVIFRYPIDNNFIAAVLAVIGYSLNSTIVVFDRLRENRRLFGSRLDAAQLANLSLNDTFARTVSTDLCVLAALATLAIVSAISDIESTLRFSLPMMFGVISGCYSSLFISTTLWVSWCEIKSRINERRGNSVSESHK